ncbi:MAG: hypothetical protein JSS66_18765 [Armatimonadetes bacterium]|nr:hypothetical protein [Armatimonadota bacterium]
MTTEGAGAHNTPEGNMITCPNCKNSLPDWATSCQFCNADVRGIPRPKGSDDVPRHGGKLPDKTLWTIYYVLCAFWIVNGGANLILALTSKQPNYISLAFGVFQLLVGLGLVLKLEIVRGIVNVLSFLSILQGLLGLIGSLMSILAFGALGLIFVLVNIITIVIAGATVWIIGETQTRANL